ncbi:toxin YdaT family protein [Serratia proteamaculans]|uniref:Rha family transcriptional regulator n=1 Tax=Serratia proteamaculans TaxID=28151 RepID=A0A5Q2VF13_SERPR|nr:toxin YdaT family protein [Serratia proteamaculans]QGH64182.1 Rha family transcriptional regulator [Serratia proteamaculans]
MKIKHEQIREAVMAWSELLVRPSMKPGGRKTPAAKISEAYFSLGLTSPRLYDDGHPDALARNTQKIFRWLESDTSVAKAKIKKLLPAIEKAMPVLLLAKMRSYNSETFRELIARKERIDSEVDALFGAMIALSERANDSGPAGNTVVH